MVGADIVSTHHARFAGVAERFQFIEQPVSAAWVAEQEGWQTPMGDPAA